MRWSSNHERNRVVSLLRHERHPKTWQTLQVRCRLPCRSLASGPVKPLDPSHHPDQPGESVGYHVFAARHGQLSLFMRVSGRVQPARGRMARGATMPEEPVTTALQRALPAYSDRGGQYGGKASRALLRLHGAPSARRAAAATATITPKPKTDSWFSTPLVPPSNGGAQTTRVTRFCRPGRRASQHRRLF